MGASRLEQTNALFRKNLVIQMEILDLTPICLQRIDFTTVVTSLPITQRRACKTNCCLVLFPLLLCSVVGGLQIAIRRSSSTEPPTRLDCACSNVTVDENAMGGLSLGCPDECPLPRAPRWPPLLQIPPSQYRAVGDGLFPFTDLPDASCRATGSCPATFLVTGGNQSFVTSVMDNMFFPDHSASVNLTDATDDGTFKQSFLQNKCAPNQTLSYPEQFGNEIANRAYDFLSSDQGNFNLIISYNSSNSDDVYYAVEGLIPILNEGGSVDIPNFAQVPRLANMDSCLLYGLWSFSFRTELVLQVILTNLVYERQKKLRIMMKMHGLGDLPYWTISYCYFLLLSLLYVLSFMLFGSILGLSLFRQNSYGVQFIFYFAYMNLQISFAFLMATYFSSVRTAAVTGYLYIFVSGLLADVLFRHYIEDVYLSRQDGNADKIAVRGISLCMSHGQCLGVLGPNGAGKTTLINMLTGFSKPTSGTAYIEGMDIRLDMDRIYTGIGVCPQDE
nr:unnamed protein product [Digitaria exilis]